MIERVAYLSIHTSPLAVPGSGDAGGMNVYVHELAQTMAGRGVQVDVFTRGGAAAEIEVVPGYRVVQVACGGPGPAGGTTPWPPRWATSPKGWRAGRSATAPPTTSCTATTGCRAGPGSCSTRCCGCPLAISFHTLGRVKDATRRADEAPAGLLRLAAETEVIARAGCVIASTPTEAAQLIEHYAANPERLCISPPGVDHEVFRPGSRAEARAALGLAGRAAPWCSSWAGCSPSRGPTWPWPPSPAWRRTCPRPGCSSSGARAGLRGRPRPPAAPRAEAAGLGGRVLLPPAGAPPRPGRPTTGRPTCWWCRPAASPSGWWRRRPRPAACPVVAAAVGGLSPRRGRRGVGDPGVGLGPRRLRRRPAPHPHRTRPGRPPLRRGRSPRRSSSPGRRRPTACSSCTRGSWRRERARAPAALTPPRGRAAKQTPERLADRGCAQLPVDCGGYWWMTPPRRSRRCRELASGAGDDGGRSAKSRRPTRLLDGSRPRFVSSTVRGPRCRAGRIPRLGKCGEWSR